MIELRLHNPTQFWRLSCARFLLCCSTGATLFLGCHRDSPPIERDLSKSAPSVASVQSPSSPAVQDSPSLRISELQARQRVSSLPEIVELANATVDGKKMRPVVEVRNTASCSAETCRYHLDVTDKNQDSAAEPLFRFQLDAQSSELFVHPSDPYPPELMPYNTWHALEARNNANMGRIFALPEVIALKRAVNGKKVPYCGTAYVGIIRGTVPRPGCTKGNDDCRWEYDIHTPNGCVASRWHSFHIDDASGEIFIDNLVEGVYYRYADKAKWSRVN